MHPNDDTIYEIAYKEASMEILTMEEVLIKNHFLECENCKNKFLEYLSALEFLTGDGMDQYFFNMIEKKENSIQHLSQAIVYHSLRLMIDLVNHSVKYAQDSVGRDYAPFVQAKAAVSRSMEESELRLLSKDSVITYDPDTNLLTVSLDQEEYHSPNMEMAVQLPYETRTVFFSDNGFGYWEAELEVEETDFTIIIKETDFSEE